MHVNCMRQIKAQSSQVIDTAVPRNEEGIEADLGTDPGISDDAEVVGPSAFTNYEEAEYELEAILDRRVSADYKLVEYKVKFVGWDEPEWVPEDNFQGHDMLYAYERANPLNPTRKIPGFRAFVNAIKRRAAARGIEVEPRQLKGGLPKKVLGGKRAR